jgi:hypothetical protein
MQLRWSGGVITTLRQKANTSDTILNVFATTAAIASGETAPYLAVNPAATSLNAILDGNHHPLSTQTPLDGKGKKLVIGESPVYNKFEVYKRLPFAPLNLP